MREPGPERKNFFLFAGKIGEQTVPECGKWKFVNVHCRDEFFGVVDGTMFQNSVEISPFFRHHLLDCFGVGVRKLSVHLWVDVHKTSTYMAKTLAGVVPTGFVVFFYKFG